MKRKSYTVKEIFYTLQGEGGQAGRPAVFCRFSGCNLWTGRESDRQKAICQFCDTDFIGTDGLNGGKYTAEALAAKVKSLWPSPAAGRPYVVCTGGEPALQLDEGLVAAFKKQGFEVAVETNGTVELPKGIDWICVSPKAFTDIVVTKGHELKLVYPQKEAEPARYAHLEFDYFFLQPLDAPQQQSAHTQAALAYCLAHPQWRLSLQTHKILAIP